MKQHKTEYVVMLGHRLLRRFPLKQRSNAIAFYRRLLLEPIPTPGYWVVGNEGNLDEDERKKLTVYRETTTIEREEIEL